MRHASTQSPKQILIVDDEVDLLESLSEVFADEGFFVETAVNGLEALAKLTSMGRPCVVILDLQMPVMTGNEFYARMMADSRFSDIPVIVSTSDPSRSPPGLRVLKKPVNLDVMLAAVNRLF